MTRLVSYLLFAYNQERFIEAALKSAFAQAYEPMEIIVTDDCSTDRTAELIRRVLATYDGSKTVRFIRNAQNLGLATAINKAAAAAASDLIVMAAGDDESRPDRTRVIAEKFGADPDIQCLFSNADVVDSDGRFQRIWYPEVPKEKTLVSFEQPAQGVLGATSAYRRRLFELFGPMSKDVLVEDRVLPFRAAILGKIGYIDEVLVRYRVHENNAWSRAERDLSDVDKWRRHLAHRNGFKVTVLENRLRDIETALGLVPERREELELVRDKTVYALRRSRAEDVMYGNSGLRRKIWAAAGFLRSSGFRPRQAWGWIKRFFFYKIYYDQYERARLQSPIAPDMPPQPPGKRVETNS